MPDHGGCLEQSQKLFLTEQSQDYNVQQYYHTPLDVIFDLQNIGLPRLLNAIKLLIPPTPAEPVDEGKKWVSTSKYEEDERHQVDLSPLKIFGGTKLCYGKEWDRSPVTT
ncbi:hypothetical protein FS837_001859 [Tulasnella sp. UAMH 9824]|nr:hypothetical protein FS837_001859 [Tulasnella sp. UAMH 9824]